MALRMRVLAVGAFFLAMALFEQSQTGQFGRQLGAQETSAAESTQAETAVPEGESAPVAQPEIQPEVQPESQPATAETPPVATEPTATEPTATDSVATESVEQTSVPGTSSDTTSSAGSLSDPLSKSLLLVPFQKLSSILDGTEESRILLPYSTYQEFLDRIEKLESEQAARVAVLSNARYVVRRDLKRIEVTTDWTFHSTASNTQSKMNLGSAFISRIEHDSATLIQSHGNGEFTLHFPQAGEHRIQLTFVVHDQVDSQDPRSLLSLPPATNGELVIEGGASSAELILVPQLPELGATAEAPAAGGTDSGDPGSATPEDNALASQPSTKRFAVAGIQQVEIHWPRPAVSHPAGLAMAVAIVNQSVSVGQKSIAVNSRIMLQSRIESQQVFRFTLPKSGSVLTVTGGETLRKWEVTEEAERKVLTVELANPTNSLVSFNITSQFPVSAPNIVIGGLSGEIPYLGVSPLGAANVSGSLTLSKNAEDRLKVNSTQGLRRTGVVQLSQEPNPDRYLSYSFSNADYSIDLSVEAIQPRITLSSDTRIDVDANQISLASKLDYLVEHLGVFELQLQLSPGLVLESVTGPAIQDYQVENGLLTIRLQQSQIGRLRIEIRARQPLPSSIQDEFNLPSLHAVNADLESGSIYLVLNRSYDVQINHAGLVNAVPLNTRSLEDFGASRHVAGWSYSEQPVTIPVKLIERATQIATTSATSVDVQSERVKVSTRLKYEVGVRGVSAFRFDVPEDISDRIQISIPADAQGNSIRQTTASQPVQGRVIWTVETQREVFGNQEVQIVYDFETPLNTVDQKTATDAITAGIQIPRPLGYWDAVNSQEIPLTQSRGEIRIESDKTLSVSTAQTTGFEELDLRELTLLPKTGVLAFRYRNTDSLVSQALQFSVRKFEITALPTTVVRKALSEIVIGTDPRATYRSLFQIYTSERQRILIALPAQSEILGVYLDDREVKLETSTEKLPEDLTGMVPYWLNVTRESASETQLNLALHFLRNLHPNLGESQFGSGMLELQLPQVDPLKNRIVQEQQVILWTPKDYSLVGNAGHFQRLPVPPHRHTSVLLTDWICEGRELPGTLQNLPTEGRHPYLFSKQGTEPKITVRWWNHFAMSVIFSLAVVLMGWTLLKTSWENRIGILLFFVFLGSLYALKDASLVHEIWKSARYGVILTLVLWILHALLRSSGRRPHADHRPDPSSATVNTTS